MTVRKLAPKDFPALRVFYNAVVPQINAIWPGGAKAYTALEAIQIFGARGGVNFGSFNGTVLRGVLSSRPTPEDGVEDIWLWMTLPTLSDADFHAAFSEMLTASGWDMLARGVKFGTGHNPAQYVGRMEVLFQRMIEAGMPMEEHGQRGSTGDTQADTQDVRRVVRMTPQQMIDVFSRIPPL